MRTPGTPGGWALGAPPRASSTSGTDQVDARTERVAGLHEPRIDVDVAGAPVDQDGVQGEGAVPRQVGAQDVEVVTDLRQVDRLLVAGPSPGALPHPQVDVGGDEPPPVEHGLDHDQRTVERGLDDHAAEPEPAVGDELVGQPPGLPTVLHAHDTTRRRPDGEFHVGREHLPRPEPVGVRHHRRRGLGEAEPVQGRLRGHLVLHGGEGGEVRHHGGHPARRQAVRTGRQDGNLLLGGEQHVEGTGRPDRQGRVEPGERVRAVRRGPGGGGGRSG